MVTLKKKKVIQEMRVKKTITRKAIAKKSLPKAKKKSPIELKRSHHNPIIEPEGHKYWESKAAFNPSAIYHDGKVHVIYRAIGDSDISVLGYGKSDDGYFFDRNLKEMAYYHKVKMAVIKDLPQISYC